MSRTYATTSPKLWNSDHAHSAGSCGRRGRSRYFHGNSASIWCMCHCTRECTCQLLRRRAPIHDRRGPSTIKAVTRGVRPHQQAQQTGMLFIIMQQVHPDFIIAVMQSQQASIIAQQAGSPLVQVTQTPSSVGSTLHIPIVKL
jgi:hypothetical protein